MASATTVLIAFAAILIVAWLANGWRKVVVGRGETALHYRNGAFVRELAPGVHRWLDPVGSVEVVKLSTLPRVLTGREATVLTRDQFSFRVTITPIIEIASPREVHEATPRVQVGQRTMAGDPFERVGPLLTEATLAAVARLTLDEFLADPQGALAGIGAMLEAALPGARLQRLALTQLTLPPEVRKMFTEVERVRREGLAALEKARSEQAALRALANAARSLAGNPQLAQLRALHAMESSRGAKTFVIGSAVLDPAATVEPVR